MALGTSVPRGADPAIGVAAIQPMTVSLIRASARLRATARA
jgi:hypothetical protein